MRWLLVGTCLTLLAGCGAVDGGTTGTAAGAQCAGPQLVVHPDTVAPGELITITGDYFFATCNDGGVHGEDPPRPEPLTGLTVVLRQGERKWTLADDITASGRLWSISVRAAIPGDAVAGPAEVVVPDHTNPVPVTIGAS